MSEVSVPPVRAGERPRVRSRWRTAASVATALAAFVAMAAVLSSGLGLVDMARWAAAQQRAFHDMVTKLLAIDGAGPVAILALISACLAYGFIHALIPGHGKFLIAGAGLASRMTAFRLVVLSLAGSIAQALTAIALVYGSFALLDITAGWAMIATDRVLIPASYVAIIAISIVLIRRAAKGFSAFRDPHHSAGHDSAGHGEGCNHRHGPSLEEAGAIQSFRDAAMLVIGIGLRPCTGAVFVLVAAWRLDLLWVGVGCALAMALGTGAFISIVALSAVSARGATLVAAGAERVRYVVPVLQLMAGLAIFFIALAFLIAALFPG